jgi:APA family basic amino acid/polyamine antiporter
MMRKLNFYQALAIGLGNIIGAGIFVMAGSSISAAGPGAILAFLITALYAVSVGLNSAELSSIFTDVEGGVYSFTLKSLGETSGFLVGWFRVIAYSIGGGATALGFSGYLVQVGLIPPPLYYPVAALLILTLLTIDYLGLRLAAEVESGLVVLSVMGLTVFIVSSFVLAGIRPNNFIPLLPHGVYGLLTASNIAFFAYSGFNTVATLTPSTENGEKVIPKAIVASLILSALLYMAVVTAMVNAVMWTSFGENSAPLDLVLGSLHSPKYLVDFVTLTALSATISVTLSTIIAGERTLRQLSGDFRLPFSGHPLMLVGSVMLLSLFLGNVEAIALASNFGIVFSYMLTGVEVMRVRRRGLRGKFRSPAYPWLQVASTVLSVIFLISLGGTSLAIGAVTLLVGLVIYEILREERR